MNIFAKFWDYYVEFNLKRTTGIDLEINKILLVLALGFCAANLFINYKQSRISTVLRKLIRKKAYGKENAVSLKQIGLADSKSYVRLLNRKEGVLKSLIKTVGEEQIEVSRKVAEVDASEAAADTVEPDSNVAGGAEIAAGGGAAAFKSPRYAGGSALLTAAEEELKASALKNSSSEEARTFFIDGKSVEDDQSRVKAAVPYKEGRPEENPKGKAKATPARYYIPFEAQSKAIQMLERNNASFTKALLGSALILACTMALVLLIPPVVNWIFI